jgi:hypothetical protein
VYKYPPSDCHYEFLCKSASVPVHYCAETFTNDGSLSSLIMKALKRTMAGEYSRELGVKVLAGQKRLACLGFKQGGAPGYGLRRMLISAERTPKQCMEAGDRKSIATDRVILVPGPVHEVQVVRDIYRMLVFERLTVYAIARALNRKGIRYMGDSDWDYGVVHNILTHPKYAGDHVFGRTSSKLSTPTVRLPKSEWIITAGAFEPVVSRAMFGEAQRILEGRTINKTDEEILDSLRALLAREERLSHALVANCPSAPSPSTYRKRFGGMRRAYELIGYGCSAEFDPIIIRRRTQTLHNELMTQITMLSPDKVSVVRRGGKWRTRLQIDHKRHVAVIISRTVRVWKDTIRWQVDPVSHESGLVTLLARLDPDNKEFQDFYVFHKMDRRRRFTISLFDEWLKGGYPLKELSDFCSVVNTACSLLVSRVVKEQNIKTI